LRSLTDAHVPDPGESATPTLPAALVRNVTPPVARARNWFTPVDSSSVAPLV
jgi:hypothetical protein